MIRLRMVQIGALREVVEVCVSRGEWWVGLCMGDIVRWGIFLRRKDWSFEGVCIGTALNRESALIYIDWRIQNDPAHGVGQRTRVS